MVHINTHPLSAVAPVACGQPPQAPLAGGVAPACAFPPRSHPTLSHIVRSAACRTGSRRVHASVAARLGSMPAAVHTFRAASPLPCSLSCLPAASLLSPPCQPPALLMSIHTHICQPTATPAALQRISPHPVPAIDLPLAPFTNFVAVLLPASSLCVLPPSTHMHTCRTLSRPSLCRTASPLLAPACLSCQPCQPLELPAFSLLPARQTDSLYTRSQPSAACNTMTAKAPGRRAVRGRAAGTGTAQAPARQVAVGCSAAARLYPRCSVRAVFPRRWLPNHHRQKAVSVGRACCSGLAAGFGRPEPAYCSLKQ